MSLINRVLLEIQKARVEVNSFDGTMLEEEVATLTHALYEIEQACKEMVDTDDTTLLNLLAREWRETPEKLMSRLIQKENFERHGHYLAVNAKFQTHECTSMDCFLKAKKNG